MRSWFHCQLQTTKLRHWKRMLRSWSRPCESPNAIIVSSWCTIVSSWIISDCYCRSCPASHLRHLLRSPFSLSLSLSVSLSLSLSLYRDSLQGLFSLITQAETLCGAKLYASFTSPSLSIFIFWESVCVEEHSFSASIWKCEWAEAEIVREHVKPDALDCCRESGRESGGPCWSRLYCRYSRYSNIFFAVPRN